MQTLGRVLSRLGLMAAGCVLGVVILELAVRILIPQNLETLPQGLLELDSTLGYRLVRNYHGEQRQVEFSIVIETNSAGLRDREYGEKTANTIRILALGDSFTFGNGVSASRTWPKVLEKLLQENMLIRKWEVINAGVGGYGPAHFGAYLREICAHWKPNYVLVGFLTCCDVGREIRHDYYIKDGRVYISALRRNFRDAVIYPVNDYLRQRSELYVLLKARLRSIIARLWGAKLRGDFVFPQTFIKSAQVSLEASWHSALHHMQQLSAYARACSNARTYLVLIPSIQQVSPKRLQMEESIYRISEGDVDVELPNRILLRFGEDNKIPTLDLLPRFAEWARIQSLYYPIDGHWNENGQRLAGQLIYEWLVANRLVPADASHLGKVPGA